MTLFQKIYFFLLFHLILISCSTNPYKKSEKVYDEKLSAIKETISEKELTTIGKMEIPKNAIDSLYLKQLLIYKASISKTGGIPIQNGINTEWIGTVNFNLRKPNFVIIHHTAQDSLQQTVNTFTKTVSKVSAHYVIGEDGKIVHMLNDYLRAWHAGISSWGKNYDINSTSIGIELDNNGSEPFSDLQINSLLALLTKLKKDYNIPTDNFIGHSDIAPSRKKDPSALFPWKTLAKMGFGMWPDDVEEQAPATFDAEQGLRIIGYNTQNLAAAITAFKLHFIQNEVDAILDQKTINAIYNLSKRY